MDDRNLMLLVLLAILIIAIILIVAMTRDKHSNDFNPYGDDCCCTEDEEPAAACCDPIPVVTGGVVDPEIGACNGASEGYLIETNITSITWDDQSLLNGGYIVTWGPLVNGSTYPQRLATVTQAEYDTNGGLVGLTFPVEFPCLEDVDVEIIPICTWTPATNVSTVDIGGSEAQTELTVTWDPISGVDFYVVSWYGAEELSDFTTVEFYSAYGAIVAGTETSFTIDEFSYGDLNWAWTQNGYEQPRVFGFGADCEGTSEMFQDFMDQFV